MILLTILGVAFVGVSILYVLYYVTTLAGSVHDVQVRMRSELQAKEEQIRELVDKGLKERGDWARAEVEEAMTLLRADVAEGQEAHRREVAQNLERIVKELLALKAAIDASSTLPTLPQEDEAATPPPGRPQGRA